MQLTNYLYLNIENRISVRNKTIQKIFGLLIVLLPLLLPYKFPFTSYSITTILSLVLAVFSVVILWIHRTRIRFFSILFLIVFLIYAISKSNSTIAISYLIAAIVFLTISTGYVKPSQIRKYIETISVFATCVVILQTIIHYLLGRHIPFVLTSLCTEDIKYQYYQLAGTGISDGHYRPSAFFLEPAHYSQFCIFGLASCLLKKQLNIKKAIFISLGVVLTTSGMGIALTIVTWSFWAVVYNWSWIKRHFLKFFCFLFASFLIVLLLYQVPFVKFAVGRIIGTDGDMSAIEGRLFFWNSFFGELNAKSLIFGFGQSTLPTDAYFTGFMVYLWAYGIIGFVLFFTACFQLFVTSKILAKYFIMVFFVLTFFANQTNIAGIIFNLGIILALRKEFY